MTFQTKNHFFKFSKNNTITNKPQKVLPETNVLLSHPAINGWHKWVWKITMFYIKPQKKTHIIPRKSHVQEFEWDIEEN